jgi:hypothetical protein
MRLPGIDLVEHSIGFLTSSPCGHAGEQRSAVLGSCSFPRSDIRRSLKLHKPEGGPTKRANHGSIGDSPAVAGGTAHSRFSNAWES